MVHFWFLFCVIILIAGAAGILYTFLQYRQLSMPLLKPYGWYLVFFNGSTLIKLITKYTCANILGSCLWFKASIYETVLAPFAYLCTLGMAVSLLWLFQIVRGKKSSPGHRAAVLFLTVLIIAATLFQSALDKVWLGPILKTVYLGLIALSLAVFIFLLIKNGSPGLRHFAGFHLILYTLLISTGRLPEMTRIFAGFPMQLAVNLFPFWWIGRALKPSLEMRLPPSENEQDPLEALCREHSISKREREITELILKGKSNKEIESALYISSHTVKNHIYNLYQKLGINSRGQLVNMILEQEKYQ